MGFSKIQFEHQTKTNVLYESPTDTSDRICIRVQSRIRDSGMGRFKNHPRCLEFYLCSTAALWFTYQLLGTVRTPRRVRPILKFYVFAVRNVRTVYLISLFAVRTVRQVRTTLLFAVSIVRSEQRTLQSINCLDFDETLY